MLIPVVLKDGHEELVSKDELQFMLANKQVVFFKRFGGWVVVGRDPLRDKDKGIVYSIPERRSYLIDDSL